MTRAGCIGYYVKRAPKGTVLDLNFLYWQSVFGESDICSCLDFKSILFFVLLVVVCCHEHFVSSSVSRAEKRGTFFFQVYPC
jgi:hypothetical protein